MCISFLAARLSGTCLLMSACCNSVNKSNLQKNGRFSITSIRKILIGGFMKKANRSNTSTGPRPDRKMRFILGELFDTWSYNPMTGSDFDWMVSNHAVWGSCKSICIRRFSPLAPSLFRFHLSPFPPETPDTQANGGFYCVTGLGAYIWRGFPLSHKAPMLTSSCSLNSFRFAFIVYVSMRSLLYFCGFLSHVYSAKLVIWFLTLDLK